MDVRAEIRMQVDRRSALHIPSFASYLEVFERSIVETCLRRGIACELESYSESDILAPPSEASFLTGYNEHALFKAAGAREYFGKYEDSARSPLMFALMEARGTLYGKDMYQSISERSRSRLSFVIVPYKFIKRQVRFVNLYENMKREGRYVSDGRRRHASGMPEAIDIPWSIQYPHARKLRDGSHRRACAIALGWKEIPHLIFRYEDPAWRPYVDAHPYLREHFDQFDELVSSATAR